MTMELFMKALLIVSVLTGLFTQAIKKQLDELKKTYFTNLLTGIVAIIMAILVGVSYVILKDITLNIAVCVDIIILALMSWICAMVGYDKVVQSIHQIILENSKEESGE